MKILEKYQASLTEPGEPKWRMLCAPPSWHSPFLLLRPPCTPESHLQGTVHAMSTPSEHQDDTGGRQSSLVALAALATKLVARAVGACLAAAASDRAAEERTVSLELQQSAGSPGLLGLRGVRAGG